MTIAEASERWGISQRQVQHLCTLGSYSVFAQFARGFEKNSLFSFKKLCNSAFPFKIFFPLYFSVYLWYNEKGS